MEKRILIVDDDAINREFFDVMLTKLGFQVIVASDGEEALHEVQTARPDLIITDNIMPKVNGWELTKTIKQAPEYEDYRDIPIIMFSALDNIEDKIEGLELGVEDYITKPFNFSEVLARIRAVLRTHEMAHQIMAREQRLSLVESLNRSLVFFTSHLRRPVLDLLESAGRLDCNEADGVRIFLRKVREEAESALAALDGLEDQIDELRNRDDEIRARELSLADLEAKYKRNFERHHQNWSILSSVETADGATNRATDSTGEQAAEGPA